MPLSHFYGISRETLSKAVENMQAACADPAKWAPIYDNLTRIRRVPRLGYYGPPIEVEKEPIARVDYYRGFPPLSATEPPAFDSPAMKWLLEQLTMMTAVVSYVGGDDKFNGTFSDGLQIDSRYPAEADRAEFKMFGERIFWTTPSFPGGLEFLNNPDAFCAYLSPESLKELLDTESRVGLLARVSKDLAASTESLDQIYGREIDQMLHFMRLVQSMRLDFYYQEYCT